MINWSDRTSSTTHVSPRFTLAWADTLPPAVRWRIHVYCVNCSTKSESYYDTRPRGGCLDCYRLVERLNAVVHLDEWRSWRKALNDDAAAAPICADWLEEHGLPEVAKIMREVKL